MNSFNYTTRDLIEHLTEMIREGRCTKNKYYKSFISNWKECLQVPEDRCVLLGFLPLKPFALFDKDRNE